MKTIEEKLQEKHNEKMKKKRRGPDIGDVGYLNLKGGKNGKHADRRKTNNDA